MAVYPYPGRVVEKRWLLIDITPGLWFSLGVHIDFKRPYVDIHFIWWIVTIGNYYHLEDFPDYEA